MSARTAYNPKYGKNGRVAKDEFSIDGKSWDYRDPSNYNDSSSGRSGEFWEENDYNRHSYEYTNPLYDYDYGTVRDAASELGIGNVNKQEEVDRLLEYIQNPKTVEVPVETPVKEVVEEEIPPEEQPNMNAELSPEMERSKNFLDSHIEKIYDGTSNDSLFKQPAGTTAAKMNATSTVPEEKNNAFDTSVFLDNFREDLADKMNFKSNFPFGE